MLHCNRMALQQFIPVGKILFFSATERTKFKENKKDFGGKAEDIIIPANQSFQYFNRARKACITSLHKT